jgi:hypothetical protein
MNEEQHGTSINSLAEAIARRITSIRNLAAEKGEPYPTDEIAGQFSLMCERSVLHFGPSAPAALKDHTAVGRLIPSHWRV